jgi:hypothetical protein
VQPFWVTEAWSNFAYFNHLGSSVNERMRPWEALLRDPWWIFTSWRLLNAIKKTYGYTLWSLIRTNNRFAVMLGCMFISIVFLLTDVVVNAAHITTSSGINPYWRFALVFKCASDTIFLDDFKSVLDDIVARKFSSAGGTAHRGSRCHGRSQSYSSMRGNPDLIECDPIPGPTTNITSPQPAAKQSETKTKWLNPFVGRGRKVSVPKIHVRQEMTVTREMRKPSQDSWGSQRRMLRAPEVAMYADNKEGECTAVLSAGHAGSNA